MSFSLSTSNAFVFYKTKNSTLKAGDIVVKYGKKFRPAKPQDKGPFGVVVEVVNPDLLKIMVARTVEANNRLTFNDVI